MAVAHGRQLGQELALLIVRQRLCQRLAMLHRQQAIVRSLDQLRAAMAMHGGGLEHQAARYTSAVGQLLHGRVHWCTHAAPLSPKKSP